MMSLISLLAKKRPGQAYLPCPKCRLLDSVVANWYLLAFSGLLSRSLE